MNFSTWERATHCTGGPTPGALALLAWLREEYADGWSMGIYNCRSVRGSATTSLHGEGRAVDWGWPMVNGKGTASGERIVTRLGAHGRRLGIQCIIYNRQIWSATSPNGREYTGVHPHYDHHHIELTRAAGNHLTLATLRSVLGGSTAPEPEKKDWFTMATEDDLRRVIRDERDELLRERANETLRVAMGGLMGTLMLIRKEAGMQPDPVSDMIHVRRIREGRHNGKPYGIEEARQRIEEAARKR